MSYISQTLTTKEEKQKQNKRMKLKAQLQKYTLKKERVTQDMQVGKHLFLLVVVSLTDPKVKVHTK